MKDRRDIKTGSKRGRREGKSIQVLRWRCSGRSKQDTRYREAVSLHYALLVFGLSLGGAFGHSPYDICHLTVAEVMKP